MRGLAAVALVLAGAGTGAAAAAAAAAVASASEPSLGYALRFQGDHPVAAMAAAVVDPEAPGFRLLKREFAASAWIRTLDAGRGTGSLGFAWTTKAEQTWMLMFGAGMDVDGTDEYMMPVTFLFNNQNRQGLPFFSTDWKHYSLVFVNDTLRVYVDGELALASLYPLPSDKTIVQPGSQFMFGVLNYGEEAGTFVVHKDVSFNGMVDDFHLFARALSAEEVRELYLRPTDPRAPVPEDLVLHYTFDVTGCGEDPPNGPSCALTGDRRVPNFGSAGSDYDLLLGSMVLSSGVPTTRWLPTVGTAESCPQPFATPVVTAGRPTSIELAPWAPHVHYVFAGVVSELNMTALTGHSEVILTALPRAMDLWRKTDSSRIELGDDIRGEDVVLVNATAPDRFQVGLASGTTVEVHVWAWEPPERVEETLTMNVKEGESVWILLESNCVTPLGEEADVVLTRGPNRGELRDDSGALIQEGTVVASAVGGMAKYFAERNVRRLVTRMEMTCVSVMSGLASDTFLLEVVTIGVNKPPVVGDMLQQLLEDNAAVVHLDAQDREGGGVARITALPTKGTLLVNGRPVSEPFNEYGSGDIIMQYVDDVVGVSSFWGGGFDVRYHPLNVIGPTTCQINEGGECANFGSHVDPSKPGTFIMTVVERDGPQWLAGKVVDSYASEDGSQTLVDVEAFPFYTASNPWDPATYVECRRGGGNLDPSFLYPSQCEVDGYDPPASKIVRGIDLASVRPTGASVWCPAFRAANDLVNYTVQTWPEAGAAGARFMWESNPGHLHATNQPPFTEWIEVKFARKVEPYKVEVGHPRGGGGVVSIKGLGPDGNWLRLYEGSAQRRKAGDTEQGYILFSEDTCMMGTMIDTLRIEIDTSAETGVADWNYIDHVKLIGATSSQAAVLPMGVLNVTYVPLPNAVGTDTFRYKMVDCTGSAARSSDSEGTATLEILAEQDKPVPSIEPSPDLTGRIRVNETGAVLLLVGADVDHEMLTLTLSRLPLAGKLTLGLGGAAPVAGQELSSGFNASVEVLYTPDCTTRDDSFAFAVSDGIDTVTHDVRISADCVSSRNDTLVTSFSAVLGVTIVVFIALLVRQRSSRNDEDHLFERRHIMSLEEEARKRSQWEGRAQFFFASFEVYDTATDIISFTIVMQADNVQLAVIIIYSTIIAVSIVFSVDVLGQRVRRLMELRSVRSGRVMDEQHAKNLKAAQDEDQISLAHRYSDLGSRKKLLYKELRLLCVESLPSLVLNMYILLTNDWGVAGSHANQPLDATGESAAGDSTAGDAPGQQSGASGPTLQLLAPLFSVLASSLVTGYKLSLFPRLREIDAKRRAIERQVIDATRDMDTDARREFVRKLSVTR